MTQAQANLLRAAYLDGSAEHTNGSIYVLKLNRKIKADYRSIHALGALGLVEWRRVSGTYETWGAFGRGNCDRHMWSGVEFKLTEAGSKLAQTLRIK